MRFVLLRGHKSGTALKMTDTASWSHGQEREANHGYKAHTGQGENQDTKPHSKNCIKF